jgi:hypothetical protein
MKFIKNNKYSILSTISKYTFAFILFFALTMPILVAHADTKKVTGINFNIKNPINVDTIQGFIEILLRTVLIIGVPIVALAIIYCGFLFVKARGNSEEIKKAKGAIMYTIVGAFLLLGAWVLANAIKNTVDDIISTT